MNLPKNISLAVCLVLAASASPAAAEDAAAPAVCWQLPAEARVDSSGVFLNQIVIPPPPVVLPQIRLAPAPLLGQTIYFSRDQILALAQSNVPAMNTTNWTGSRRVRVLRRMRQVDEAEMTALLTAALQRDYVKDLGELELHFSRPWTAAPAPDETLNVKMTEVPSTGVNANFLAGFELWNGAERVGHWQAVLQAKIWRPIPLAHSRLTRGQLLRDADVTLERRDILALHDVLLDIPKDDSSLELAENIAAGMPLFNRSARPRPLIKRGQMVEAVYEEGSLKISLKMQTLEDGLPGQTVRLRNPKTNRELNGKVQNEEIVRIAL
jgi:flagella basal body P-ring formation protein FlgA